MRTLACAVGLFLCSSLFVAACGSGDDPELTGASKPATGGSGGAAGSSGSGGTAGGDASAGSGGTGATGGTAGTAGTGGGAAGASGSGGAAGQGGSGACPGGCDDFIDCTIDSCPKDTCAHALGPCGPGLVCHVTMGCVSAPVCSSVDNCIQVWGNDACKTNLRCDDATATCAFDLLDKDDDGHAPLVCGGDDCDDSDAQRNPTVTETCDGKDNDCDGTIDDGAMCPGLLTCQGGACNCPPDKACGSECVDKNTSTAHCGACNHPCPVAASCISGSCTCPGAQVVCGSACVSTQTDPANCGACGNVCGPGYSCTNSTCTCPHTVCSNTCVNTQVDSANCGSCGNPCPTGGTCQSGACACPPATPTICDDKCVNTTTDNDHCGQCGNACANGSCQNGQCPVCLPGGMLILLDVSASMESFLGSQTRMQAQIDAVQAFVQEPASAGLSVGVMAFPRYTGSTSLCPASNYTTPDVAIDLLPANAPAIVSDVSTLTGLGNSVIIGPLDGAIGIMRSWLIAQGPSQGAVVMINDGGLTIGCTTSTVIQAVNVAAAGFNGTPSVATHVVAVSGASTGEDPQWWAQVPVAGGGTFTDASVGGQPVILDALRAVRTSVSLSVGSGSPDAAYSIP